jgi:two-component system, cell cycle response regulator
MGENLTDKPEILIVDDSRVIRHAATKMLAPEYTVHVVENGAEGWRRLQLNDAISVAFVDMQMPEMTGLELLAHIRNSDDERIASLPVIIITGADDTENTKKQIFDAGATDFISKPFVSIDLISRARSYARLSGRVVELEKKAGHDRITGLISAAGFEERGARATSFALRHRQKLSVASLEIVDFQELYQSHGKRVAQQIVIAVAKCFDAAMRTEDIAARTGVARYALLLPLTNETGARIVVDRVCESINKRVFVIGREKFRIRLAFGIVESTLAEDQLFSDLVTRADAVLERNINQDSEVGVGGRIDVIEAGKASTAIAVPAITETIVNEALQYVIAGDYSRIPEFLLFTVAERLAPFLEYVNSRSSQRPGSVRGTGER